MILVLEDMDFRVQWLTSTFPDLNVGHYDNVKEFLASVELHSAATQLIILDHDLGPDSMTSEDEDGYTGQDAADDLQATCPVLIWSANPHGSQMMELSLQRRGYEAKRLSFETNNLPHIGAYITMILSRGRA